MIYNYTKKQPLWLLSLSFLFIFNSSLYGMGMFGGGQQRVDVNMHFPPGQETDELVAGIIAAIEQSLRNGNIGGAFNGILADTMNGLGDNGNQELKKLIDGMGAEGRKEFIDSFKGVGKEGKKERQEFLDGMDEDINTQSTSIINNLEKHTRAMISGLGNTSAFAVIKVGSASLVCLSGCYFIHHGSRYIYKQFTVPKLEISKSDGWFKRMFYPTQYLKIEDLILDPTTKSLVLEYKEILENASHINQEMPNLLLVGPPGTGKSEIAKRIAQANGKTFVRISGSSFMKYPEGEGVAKMDELFAWAEKQKHGIVIFIDEIEGLLADRSGTITPKAYEILNNFLTHTGTRSKKYAIIGATNMPDKIDTAMGRRFDEMITVDLPGVTEREAILNMYLKKHVFGRQGLRIENNFITTKYVRTIAEKTDGLSGGELEGICIDFGRRGIVQKNQLLTPALATKIIQRVRAKHAAIIAKGFSNK